MNSHFSIKELLKHCSDSERQRLFSDASLSRNLVSLMSALEGIRDVLGKPITVNSSYRDAAHNKRVGGVPSSQHLTCSAADITCTDLEELVCAIRGFQDVYEQLGQVIVYDTFVHVGLSRACSEPTRVYSIRYN